MCQGLERQEKRQKRNRAGMYAHSGPSTPGPIASGFFPNSTNGLRLTAGPPVLFSSIRPQSPAHACICQPEGRTEEEPISSRHHSSATRDKPMASYLLRRGQSIRKSHDLRPVLHGEHPVAPMSAACAEGELHMEHMPGPPKVTAVASDLQLGRSRLARKGAHP